MWPSTVTNCDPICHINRRLIVQLGSEPFVTTGHTAATPLQCELLLIKAASLYQMLSVHWNDWWDCWAFLSFNNGTQTLECSADWNTEHITSFKIYTDPNTKYFPLIIMLKKCLISRLKLSAMAAHHVWLVDQKQHSTGRNFHTGSLLRDILQTCTGENSRAARLLNSSISNSDLYQMNSI